MPKLLVKTGEKKGLVVRLVDKRLEIGRQPANHLVLPDKRISRSHAVIEPDKNGFAIEDTGSVNGTFLNGKMIERAGLNPGDEIRMGDTLISFLSIDASEALDEDLSRISQVKILADHESSKSMTVELSLSQREASGLMENIDRRDTDALHKAYLRLMILYRISHELSGVVALSQLLEHILKLVTDIVRADRGFILLRDAESGEFVPRAVSSKLKRDQSEELAISNTVIKRILDTGESVLTSDAMHDSRFKEAESIVTHGVRSAMCVPIKFKDEILGIMNVDSTGRDLRFAKDDLELLTAISDQAAVAIKNAKLIDDLKKANKELKAQQAQLIEAEKLSAIGQLSSGVAHEINNPLTSILGYTELSSAQLGRQGLTEKDIKECQEFLKIVQDEAHHCVRIAQSLLQFSRRQKDEMKPTDVNKAIEAALMIAKFHIKRVSIEIKTSLNSNLPRVMGDLNQLQQVFLNLIINARDAMEKGGTISIDSKKMGEGSIEVRIKDTGCGIPQDKLEEIFKPLYTTKEEGKGTGLGLSISQDIIERHKGSITVESQVNKGTTFVITLPALIG